ncbi:MAG: kelch repeat-containing protein, partial [Pseudomonadota bacterium]
TLDGSWETLTPLPHPQAETVAKSLNGFIHVAGGRAPAGSSNTEWADHIDTDEHWYYDAGDDRWRALAPLPTPRNSAAGAVTNGVLYVIGGRTVNDGNLTAMEVYDPLSDRWEKARPMPKAQAGLAAAVLNGKIYAFGGEFFSPTGGGVFAEAWEYDPDKDDWRAVAVMPRRRHGLGAVTLSDAIYVLGGAAQAGGSETSAALDRFEI